MSGLVQYRATMIDPPWPERGGGRSKRGADRHYPLIAVRDMPAVILGSGAWNPADDAHIYLWVTNTHLLDGGDLMRALGFTYKTQVTWAKPSYGIGQYFRGQTEHMLFGTRGRGASTDVKTESRNLPGLIHAPKGRHSEKPREAHELIEARSKGPRLEMFARGPSRAGWSTWGNET